jgi:hypothetical protein
VVSKDVFASLDSYLWQLTYRWALPRHPKKSRHWIVNRYFGRFNTARQDRWVFGDRETGAYLVRFAWTKIIRHQLVKGIASPDDPALTDYWPSGDAGPPRSLWTGRPCDSCRSRRAAARSAANCCCTPTGLRSPRPGGSSGSAPPGQQ